MRRPASMKSLCCFFSLRLSRSSTFSSLHSLSSSSQFSRLPNFAHMTTDHQMLHRVLNDCKTSLDLKAAFKIHARVVKLGVGTDPLFMSSLLLAYINVEHLNLALRLLDEIPHWNIDLVTGNKIVAAFMKHGDVAAAKRVFFKMPAKDVVSWNSLIGGCVKKFQFDEAIKLFKEMSLLDVEPDEFTFSSVISGCARLGSVDLALWIHHVMIEKKIVMNDILLAALIDMYAKCGKIEIAKEIFEAFQSCDVSVWNAMITGLAIHGLASDAISIFSQMGEKNICPNNITFLAILTGCSHCGFVELGKKYFDVMRKEYLIEPELEHYGAMVDILGRAGLLEEAYATIKAMPMKPDVVVWRALLSACRSHKNSAIGEIAIKNISSLGGGDYVLLSNTFCSLNKWSSSANTREIMRREGVHKDRGKSWIELSGVLYHFKAGDRSHPEIKVISKFLKQLIERTKLEGFVPATELVLMDILEEEKEENLNFHSEKLAFAFGVLKSSPTTEIRISKNLRICCDCHSWFKIASRMFRRVIIVRDRIRFHKFEVGSCSCGDYW